MTEKQAEKFLKKVKGERIVWVFEDGSISSEIITPIGFKYVPYRKNFEIITKEEIVGWDIEMGFKKSGSGRWVFANSPTTDFILED